jgi:hypothetical protein
VEQQQVQAPAPHWEELAVRVAGEWDVAAADAVQLPDWQNWRTAAYVMVNDVILAANPSLAQLLDLARQEGMPASLLKAGADLAAAAAEQAAATHGQQPQRGGRNNWVSNGRVAADGASDAAAAAAAATAAAAAAIAAAAAEANVAATAATGGMQQQQEQEQEQDEAQQQQEPPQQAATLPRRGKGKLTPLQEFVDAIAKHFAFGRQSVVACCCCWHDCCCFFIGAAAAVATASTAAITGGNQPRVYVVTVARSSTINSFAVRVISCLCRGPAPAVQGAAPAVQPLQAPAGS